MTTQPGWSDVTSDQFKQLAAEVDAEWEHILANGGAEFLAAIDKAVLQDDYDDEEGAS